MTDVLTQDHDSTAMATAERPESTPALDGARQLKLLGLNGHFDGYAGMAIGTVPTLVLRRARAYFAARADAETERVKKSILAGQYTAIDLVLDDRWRVVAGSGDAADHDNAAGNEDPESPMVLGRRIAAILTHPALTDHQAQSKVRAYLDKAGGSAANLRKRIDTIAHRLKIAV